MLVTSVVGHEKTRSYGTSEAHTSFCNSNVWLSKNYSKRVSKRQFRQPWQLLVLAAIVHINTACRLPPAGKQSFNQRHAKERALCRPARGCSSPKGNRLRCPRSWPQPYVSVSCTFGQELRSSNQLAAASIAARLTVRGSGPLSARCTNDSTTNTNMHWLNIQSGGTVVTQGNFQHLGYERLLRTVKPSTESFVPRSPRSTNGSNPCNRLETRP